MNSEKRMINKRIEIIDIRDLSGSFDAAIENLQNIKKSLEQKYVLKENERLFISFCNYGDAPVFGVYLHRLENDEEYLKRIQAEQLANETKRRKYEELKKEFEV
jgi:hypothetical protein